MHHTSPRILVGHSALFRTIEGLSSRLANSREPVELVFPARPDEYLPLMAQLDSIAERLITCQPGVLSIHAPPLSIESDQFAESAILLARLAENVGAAAVTFHPSKCRRLDGFEPLQQDAVANLRRAQQETSVVLAVETLGHRRCLFNEEEIVAFGLPMVLDTTHVGWERSTGILRDYGDHIGTIHLSERTPDALHQPVGQASFEFVSLLVEIGWSGSVVLEYWPWRWKRYAEDVPRVRSVLDLSAAASSVNGDAAAHSSRG